MAANEKDTRIVYGAGCGWWDSIDKVGTLDGSGLPCCPHCHGVLFETESLDIWWEGVDKYEANGHPGYHAFVEWIRGKCISSWSEAKEIYERETGKVVQ